MRGNCDEVTIPHGMYEVRHVVVVERAYSASYFRARRLLCDPFWVLGREPAFILEWASRRARRKSNLVRSEATSNPR